MFVCVNGIIGNSVVVVFDVCGDSSADGSCSGDRGCTFAAVAHTAAATAVKLVVIVALAVTFSVVVWQP